MCPGEHLRSKAMKVRSIILVACILISTGAIVTGYASAGHWLILLAIAFLTFFWTFTRRRSEFWSASIFLLGFVIFAANGIATGLSFHLMLIGCTASLAAWDLMLFNQSLAGSMPGKAIASLERHHLQSLAAAVIAGLLLALLTSNIEVQFPFGVIVLLVLITIGCLIFSMRCIMENKH